MRSAVAVILGATIAATPSDLSANLGTEEDQALLVLPDVLGDAVVLSEPERPDAPIESRP